MSASNRNPATVPVTFTLGTSGVSWSKEGGTVPWSLFCASGYPRSFRIVNPRTGGSVTFYPRSPGDEVWLSAGLRPLTATLTYTASEADAVTEWADAVNEAHHEVMAELAEMRAGALYW